MDYQYSMEIIYFLFTERDICHRLDDDCLHFLLLVSLTVNVGFLRFLFRLFAWWSRRLLRRRCCRGLRRFRLLRFFGRLGRLFFYFVRVCRAFFGFVEGCLRNFVFLNCWIRRVGVHLLDLLLVNFGYRYFGHQILLFVFQIVVNFFFTLFHHFINFY